MSKKHKRHNMYNEPQRAPAAPESPEELVDVVAVILTPQGRLGRLYETVHARIPADVLEGYTVQRYAGDGLGTSIERAAMLLEEPRL
jgi:hypothetical protein